jgi:hypothetical protein
MSFHTRVTLRASWYAPPDTGVSDLQLVALERLPSIEGAAEILMDITFLTRQRFLLEKQKKMLKGSHKPVQSISLLIDFRFPLLQSKFLPSIPSVSLRLTAPLAARGAGGFFFPL